MEQENSEHISHSRHGSKLKREVKLNFSPHCMSMPPLNSDYVKFTTNPGSVICQRCKVSFPQGVELHFLHDLTGEGPGKRVCDECRQYYITKTEKVVQSTTGKLLIEQ